MSCAGQSLYLLVREAEFKERGGGVLGVRSSVIFQGEQGGLLRLRRKPKLKPEQVAHARNMVDTGQETVTGMADRVTLHRALRSSERDRPASGSAIAR